MTRKLFTPSTTTRGDARVRAMLVTCGVTSCCAVGEVPFNTMAGSAGDDTAQENRHVTRKFEKLGWKIGGRGSQHRCPDCNAANRKGKEGMQHVSSRKHDPATTAIGGATPEPGNPRPINREEKRIVFEKLNEVYLDEQRGYSADWTDAKVAEALGCRRAWVTDIREEMFGPVKTNESITAAVSEARDFLGRMTVLRGSSNKLQEEVAKLSPIADKIEKTLAGIEKALR